MRRAIFACLILGNANSMPLIVMQSLCDTFPPLQQGGKCYVKSMGYASLFMTVVNIVAVRLFTLGELRFDSFILRVGACGN